MVYHTQQKFEFAIFVKYQSEFSRIKEKFLVVCVAWSVVSDSVQSHKKQPARLPVPGTLQARTLEWVAISFSNA